ncbi:hypothetical protein ACFX2C_002728 [Malus domestica]
MVLFATEAFGIWSENNTKIGSALSGALMSTLIGLAASNLEIISSNSPVYSIVLEFLFPLAVPLLLYRADWKIAAALTGRHIGGAINYVAIFDVLGPPVSGDDIANDADSEAANKHPLIQIATSLAVSLAICKAGHYVMKYYGIQ